MLRLLFEFDFYAFIIPKIPYIIIAISILWIGICISVLSKTKSIKERVVKIIQLLLILVIIIFACILVMIVIGVVSVIVLMFVFIMFFRGI